MFDDPALATEIPELLAGLHAEPKYIPSKLLYDARGSELFEEICKLDEYYLTRTELAIMHEHAAEMARRIGPDCLLVEYGSGAGTKTRILLDALEAPVAYVPIDISRSALEVSAEHLEQRDPDLVVLPVCADYMADYVVPEPPHPPRRTVAYFPGSTIGNLTHDEARRFLEHVRTLGGPAGGLLVGVDLCKEPRVLEAAYDDEQGVTARFELNVLERMNREFGANFRLDAFAYRSFWAPEEQRIEMYLVSLEPQVVEVAGSRVEFAEAEPIRVEYSHKFTLEGFAALARTAGLEVTDVWTDAERLFSVQYLTWS